MMKILLVLFSFMLMLSNPVIAQDADLCSAQSFAALLEQQAEDIRNAPVSALHRTVRQTRNLISARDARCAELAFEGDDDEVIGPIVMNAGTYIVNSEFSSYGSLFMTVVDGDCGFPLMVAEMQSGGNTDETLFQAPGSCRAFLEVDSDAAWSITFSPVA